MPSELEELFAKGLFEQVISRAENEEGAHERLFLLKSLMRLGRFSEALREIKSHRSLYEKETPLPLMKIHLEALLSLGKTEEALLELRHYEDLPYISQEGEEFLRAWPERVANCKRKKAVSGPTEKKAAVTLRTSTDSRAIARALYSLARRNVRASAPPIQDFLLRKDVSFRRLRVFALLILARAGYEEKIVFPMDEEEMTVCPASLTLPSERKSYRRALRRLVELSGRDTSVLSGAEALLEEYLYALYPKDPLREDGDDLIKVIIALSEEALGKAEKPMDKRLSALRKQVESVLREPDFRPE